MKKEIATELTVPIKPYRGVNINRNNSEETPPQTLE